MDRRAAWVAMLVSRKAEIACGVLLALMALNLIGQIRQKSITNDEIVLIPAGYYHLVAVDFRLVHEHPPLCKLLAAIPLLFIQPNEIKPEQIPATKSPGELTWAYEVAFWTNNRDAFESISFWSRLPMIGLTLGVGVLLFVFARQMFGSLAAIFATALFTVEPTVLAHGRVVQTDIPAAFGFLLLFYTMRRYSAAPSVRRAMWIGIAAATGILAKFSMLLAGPILLVFFALRLWREREWKSVFGHMLVVGVATIVVIDAAYFFQLHPLEAVRVDELKRDFKDAAGFVVTATRLLSYILPVEFVLGVLWQIAHSSVGHTAGFLGMHSKTGWWYYFPVAFALKTTLPFLALTLASLGWGTWRALAKRDTRFVWLVLPFFVYSVFLLFTGINIGVRYYLPGFMFLFVLGGALLARLTSLAISRPAGVIAAAAVLVWCALIALRVYPDYMPHMNAFASPQPRWWYLSDSNIEWGDDVKGLAQYLHARGEKSVRAALLGGFITLQFYGIDYVDALSNEPLPETRYVALGGSFLNGSTVPERGEPEAERVNRFAAFRERTPEAVIGGSIYLYRLHD